MSKKQTQEKNETAQPSVEEVAKTFKEAQAEEAATHKVAELELAVKELNDRLLRSHAEMENLRKRTLKEVEDASAYANTRFAKDLLSVMDNLFRAEETFTPALLEELPQIKGLKEGLDITKREMLQVFERNGIVRIYPEKGEAFDHNFHQAISQVESAEAAPGAVLSVMQAGYKMRERLLRPAMVVVVKA